MSQRFPYRSTRTGNKTIWLRVLITGRATCSPTVENKRAAIYHSPRRYFCELWWGRGLTDQLWLLGYRLLHKHDDSYGIETLNVDLTLQVISHSTPCRQRGCFYHSKSVYSHPSLFAASKFAVSKIRGIAPRIQTFHSDPSMDRSI